MDKIEKNQKEIEKKQKFLGKLNDEQAGVYDVVKERIAGMSKRQRIKLLKKNSNVDKLIAKVRAEMDAASS